VFSPARAHLVNPKRVTREAPDLAVEILSPATARNDRGRKMQLLARHGVKEYWLFDPDASSLEIYGLVDHGFEMVTAAGGGDVAYSRVFPDLRVRPAELVI
jgi:Uma2 family endonuclease